MLGLQLFLLTGKCDSVWRLNHKLFYAKASVDLITLTKQKFQGKHY